MVNMIRKFITVVGFNLSAILISILIIGVIFPLCIILFTPIYIFRFVVTKVSRWVRPDLGKILSTGSTNFSFDKLHEPNPSSVIVYVNILEGIISLDSLSKAFTDKVLPLKLPNGDIRYPELQQYPTDWMGFKFWKNDDKFDIRNHVKVHDSSEAVTENILKKLRHDTLVKPFPRSQSPWEMLLVNNYYPDNESSPHSVFLFRIHHTLSDGFSLMKLTVQGIFGQSLPKSKESRYEKRSYFNSLLVNAFFPFRAVFEFSKGLIHVFKPSPWHVPLPQRTFSVHAVMNPIPIESVKKCKNDMGVTFSGLILSACAGAIKATMVRKGIEVPDYISCILPFPMPGHPDKLRNHMSQVTINLPLESVTTSEDRLQLLDQSYRKLSGSTGPAFNRLLAKVVGGLFTPLVKRFATGLVPSVLISNFPANLNSLQFEGHRSIDAYYYCGLVNLPAVSIFVGTYNERIRIACVAESSLMSSNEIQELVNHIEKELIICIKSVEIEKSGFLECK